MSVLEKINMKRSHQTNTGTDETINPIMPYMPVSTAHVKEHTTNLSIFTTW